MKPESAKFIRQANIVISRADIMLTAGLNEDAARMAYMASFHVAQSYIFERTDKVSKTHNGVQTEFFRLSKGDARMDRDLRKFLALAYDYKSVADYFTSADANPSAAEAGSAIAEAKQFVAHISSLVTVPSNHG